MPTPPSVFKPGLKINDWILKEMVASDVESERWLAFNTKTNQTGTIRLIHPQEMLATGDYDFSQTNVNIETAATTLFHPGSTIDHWLLLQNIASGNTAEVWRAQHQDGGQTVALKVCVTEDPERIAGFKHEKNVLEHCSNIKGVTPILEHNESWYAFPLVTPIRQLLRPDTPLPTLVQTVLNAGEVIKMLAQHDVLYRDIKLDHFCELDGQFMLIDFGSAIYPASKIAKTNYIETEFPCHVARALAKLLQYLLQKIHLHPPHLMAIAKKFRDIDNDANALHSFCAALAQWLSGPATSQSDIDTLQTALKHYQQQEFEPAKILCNNVLDNDPNCSDALHLLGVIALAEQKMRAAIDYLQQAIEVNSLQADYYNSLGSVYLKQHRHRHAIDWFRQALSINPKHDKAYNNLVMAQVHWQEKAKARQSQRLARKYQRPKLYRHHADLSEYELKRLTNACQSKVQIISQCETRVLAQTHAAQPKNTDSYATISWDQYFFDLSVGAYRTCWDFDRRPYRSRTWHYTFKNLAIIDEILQNTQREVTVLDVGCSSGYFRRFLEGNISIHDARKIFYWGIDIRPDVMHRAVHNVKDIESGAWGNFTPALFLLHDASEGMPFYDEQFDYVVCFEFIKYLPVAQGRALLQELQRVLKPNGRLYISTTLNSTRTGFIESLSAQAFQQSLKDEGLQVMQCFGSQAQWHELQPNLDLADPTIQKIVDYYPPEIAAAILSPLYPESASQHVYHCLK